MFENSKYLLSFTISYVVTGIITLVTTVTPTYYILLVIIPVITLILYYLYKKNFYIKLGTYAVILVCGTIMWSSDFLRKHIVIDEYSITAAVFFVLNLVFAIVFPYIKPNGFTGIRIPITLNYPEIWERTHKATSAYVSGTLIPLFLLFFYTNGALRFVLCLLLVGVPLIMGAFYANIIGRPIVKEERERDANDLKEQIRKEEHPRIPK
ncbi:MAG: SdpI family protein [Clostridiales bacterium]|jgi:multisubunit Na+/H+ antiporter MnhG subunit|nr:SdpI family protein [Clostridiales bacterium]